MESEKKDYVIGVDGGGTKTTVALSDLNGKILFQTKSGPSSFIKVGVKETTSNIAKGIEKILKKTKKSKIISTFIALAAVEENPEMKRIIRKKLLSNSKISSIFQGKVTIGSDQISGFRAGTDVKEGVVLISGTGSAAHGWRGKREAHTSGWGWLNDEGSAFWLGQKAYQQVLKDLDGRLPKTLMTDLFFKKFKVKTAEELKGEIYLKNNLIENVSSLAILVNKAAEKKDRIARDLLIEAGKELALTVNTVIKKLRFRKINFPIVLIGSMFNSKIILNTVKKEVKKVAPKAEFIQPKGEPVIGAVKLAIEQISR